MTELSDAVAAGDDARARQLAVDQPELRGRRDDGGLLPAMRALYAGKTDVAEALLPPDERLDVFESAAFGRIDRLRALLDEDPLRRNDYSPDGFMPPHMAAFGRHPDATRLLVERGAELNGLSTNPTVRVAPIGTAAFSGDVESARALLEGGADPNLAEPGGGTALHTAAANGSTELVELLLQHGADPQAKLADGRTPADLARENGHEDVAKLLDAG